MNNPIDINEIKIWREQVKNSLEKYREELAEIQKAIKETEERLELLDGLLALENGLEHEVHSQSIDQDEFLESCIEIIRERGKSVHIGDLHSALLENGVPIPGMGNQANVISRIQRSDGKIIRTGRGMYGLPEFGVSEKKPVQRKKKSRSAES